MHPARDDDVGARCKRADLSRVEEACDDTRHGSSGGIRQGATCRDVIDVRTRVVRDYDHASPGRTQRLDNGEILCDQLTALAHDVIDVDERQWKSRGFDKVTDVGRQLTQAVIAEDDISAETHMMDARGTKALHAERIPNHEIDSGSIRAAKCIEDRPWGVSVPTEAEHCALRSEDLCPARRV